MGNNACKVLDISHIDTFKDEKIVIYGAGKYGKKIGGFLKLRGQSECIKYYIVSNKKDNPDCIYGIPVKELAEIKDELDQYIVLIAIGPFHIEEVFNLLQQYEMKELYQVTGELIGGLWNTKEIAHVMERIPLEQNKIFISCYEGMGYRCNCKYIAESLRRGKYPVKLVWVISNDSIQDIPHDIKTVIVDTYEYYWELYTSKICITNNMKPYLGVKREGQYFINTWHGYGPFKHVQAAMPEHQQRLQVLRTNNSYYDLFLTASHFYAQVYRESFFYQGEIYESGAPRNDMFFQSDTLKNMKEVIYRKYNISEDKKLLLYAPTFRKERANSFEKYDLDMKKILKALEERFQGEFVLMYRFHHFLYAMGKCKDFYRDGIDATYYSDMQELLAAADVLLTDYSSSMWDFSLQKRPVFLYQNDEEEYRDDRGFYCPVSEWPYPKAHTQEELISVIKAFDSEQYKNDVDAFLKKYGACDDGHASERVVRKIMSVIEAQS